MIYKGCADDLSDLSFLKEVIGDRRFVFLGENTHGVGDFHPAREKLIKYLHQEMDFEVVVYEAGLGETSAAYANTDQMSSKEMIIASMMRSHQAVKIRPLFDYIKEQKNSENPLILSGFDVQTMRSNYQAEFFRDWFEVVDDCFSERIYWADSTFLNLNQPL